MKTISSKRLKAQAYREAHRLQINAYQSAWRKRNREKDNAYHRIVHARKPELYRAKGRADAHLYRQRLKRTVLSHYSPQLTCQKCGYSDLRALSLDHVNGGGRGHMRTVGSHGCDFYKWIKQHDFPDGFQVLCMNCQWVKRTENEECKVKPRTIWPETKRVRGQA